MSAPYEFRHLAVVGNRGKMGAMLASRLSLSGYRVTGVSRTARPDGSKGLDPQSLEEALDGASLVLLCVPAAALPETLGAVVPLLTQEQILMDIASVKSEPMRLMEESFSGAVIGSHPLFGPCSEPSDLRVALVRGRRAEQTQCRAAEELFGGMGCSTFWSSAEEHDLGTGLTQSLNFALSAAFLTTLARLGDRRFLTPSCSRHLEAAKRSLTENADMFCEFTAMNPYFSDILEHYKKILHEAASFSQAGEPDGLNILAREAATWYAE
ncbi:MAG: prephenate dehydrogenase/arogenate dehydrogenase family protein [Desulfovibrionaceae bacterium]|nr:prephenate dehydrogenase/arogenate dehydrogenase family protein [Desulfovibrionaceae bacterium]